MTTSRFTTETTQAGDLFQWQVSRTGAGRVPAVRMCHMVCLCSDPVLVLAVGLSVGLLLLLLLGLMLFCLWRRTKGQNQNQYQELLSGPACTAPVILVSQASGST